MLFFPARKVSLTLEHTPDAIFLHENLIFFQWQTSYKKYHRILPHDCEMWSSYLIMNKRTVARDIISFHDFLSLALSYALAASAMNFFNSIPFSFLISAHWIISCIIHTVGGGTGEDENHKSILLCCMDTASELQEAETVEFEVETMILMLIIFDVKIFLVEPCFPLQWHSLTKWSDKNPVRTGHQEPGLFFKIWSAPSTKNSRCRLVRCSTSTKALPTNADFVCT